LGSMLKDVREQVRNTVVQAVRRARAEGHLPEESDLPEVVVEVPKDRAHGDFASNAALALAGAARTSPRALAQTLASLMELRNTIIDRVEVAGPGFLNFHLSPGWLYEVLPRIRARGEEYGRAVGVKAPRVLVEFVSANPTGPLVVVQARAAALGDVLCNLLEQAGCRVEREFYVNDAGGQFAKLGLAMEARVRQVLGQSAELPEGAYPGEYIVDLARRFLDDPGTPGPRVLSLPEEKRRSTLARYAADAIVEEQEASLDRYGVRFDRWFKESELRERGEPGKVVEFLCQKGLTYRADGALWFRSTHFGDDKDRVLMKSDGEFTYLVPDLAYHRNKLERGYDRLIDILGPDHHAHAGVLRAGLRALDCPDESFSVLISQWVRLLRGDQKVGMSKRAGEFVVMDDLLDEVGTDAARFFFLMRSHDSQLDFDLDLAKLQGQENPVYYVQYAHARICSVFRQATEQGVAVPDPTELEQEQLALLSSPPEMDLIRKLAELPGEIRSAAEALQPHRLTRYAIDLAALFHTFYTECRILGEEVRLTQARLYLTAAARDVLRGVLRLLGVSAPERM